MEKLRHLREKHGAENVILTDVSKAAVEETAKGPYCYLDVANLAELNQKVVDERIDVIIHYAALLSAVAEQNVPKALEVSYLQLNMAWAFLQQNERYPFVRLITEELST